MTATTNAIFNIRKTITDIIKKLQIWTAEKLYALEKKTNPWKISSKLRYEITDYIKMNIPEFFFDYRDKLAPEQVQRLLENPDSKNDIEIEMLDQNFAYEETLKTELINNIAEKFDLCNPETFNMTIEEIENEFIDHIYVNINLDELIQKSKGEYTTLITNAEFNTYRYNQFFYEDLEDILQILNINPRRYALEANKLVNGKLEKQEKEKIKEFPSIPERNKKEFVKPEVLAESLFNCTTCLGKLVFLMDCPNKIIENFKDIKENGMLLPENTYLILHDYLNGASSLEMQLDKDLLLKPEHIESFQIDSLDKYGLQSVNGFTSIPWVSRRLDK